VEEKKKVQKVPCNMCVYSALKIEKSALKMFFMGDFA